MSLRLASMYASSSKTDRPCSSVNALSCTARNSSDLRRDQERVGRRWSSKNAPPASLPMPSSVCPSPCPTAPEMGKGLHVPQPVVLQVEDLHSSERREGRPVDGRDVVAVQPQLAEAAQHAHVCRCEGLEWRGG